MNEFLILKSKMVERRITNHDLAILLGVDDKTIRNKLQSKSPFTWCEVCKIRDKYFEDMRLEYLFSTGEQQLQQTGS